VTTKPPPPPFWCSEFEKIFNVEFVDVTPVDENSNESQKLNQDKQQAKYRKANK